MNTTVDHLQGYLQLLEHIQNLFSGWVARAAGLGRSAHSVSSIDTIAQTRIFHRVLHYHPDNGKSIPKELFEGMKGNRKKDSLTLSRSRPNTKNDNSHVEQKNDDNIRKLVGHRRYVTPEQIDLLKKLYEKADMMDNFFIPPAKSIKKIRDGKGRVIKRVHDKPKTPFQRFLDCERLSNHKRLKLRRIFKSPRMVELRNDVNKILKTLFEGKQIISRKGIMI